MLVSSWQPIAASGPLTMFKAGGKGKEWYQNCASLTKRDRVFPGSPGNLPVISGEIQHIIKSNSSEILKPFKALHIKWDGLTSEYLFEEKWGLPDFPCCWFFMLR